MEICRICCKEFKRITPSHLQTHGITYSGYIATYFNKVAIQSHKSNNNVNGNGVTEVAYFSNYKKYKYWLGIFYLISTVLLIIMYNYRVLDTLFQYKAYKKAKPALDSLDTVIPISDTTKYRNLIKNHLNYRPKVTPWADIVAHASKHLAQREAFLMKIDRICRKKFGQVIEGYTARDSSIIHREIAKTNQAFEHIRATTEKGKERAKLVIEEKRIFSKSLRNLLNQSLEAFPYQQMTYELFRSYNLDDSDIKKIFGLSKGSYYNEIQKVDSLLSANFNIPNVIVPFRSREAIKFSLPILIILSIYIQMLYLNYKVSEKEFLEDGIDTSKTPSLKNIIDNLHIYMPFKRQVNIFLAILFNIILPIVVTIYIGIRIASLFDDPYFYLMLLLFLIPHGYFYIVSWRNVFDWLSPSRLGSSF